MCSRSLTFIRVFFVILSVLMATIYMMTETINADLTTLAIGVSSGLALATFLIAIDFLLRGYKLRSFNTAIVGLFIGYMMGHALSLVIDFFLEVSHLSLSAYTTHLMKTILYLSTIYASLILTARSADELLLSIPFIKMKVGAPTKKDIILDWTVLMDSRIIDIASSGLLDYQLIIPRLIIRELYAMLENSDEAIKNKAKRCLEVLRKLESIPTLELRYTESDFTEVKDPAHKLLLLARDLDSNILTADVARLQPYAMDSVKIINLHMLSNALKPMVTGEHINIKVQRYGKEPRQGVGYLDDGTMVVVNGGAEYVGGTIKAQVLSVKHTTSGRMIFCNAMEDPFDAEAVLAPSPEIDNLTKNYFI